MSRVRVLDVVVIDQAVIMPVSGAVLAIEFYSSSYQRIFGTTNNNDNYSRFDLSTCAKFHASSIYQTNGEYSVLDSAFVHGDKIDLKAFYSIFPLLPLGEVMNCRLLVFEYIPQAGCNCNH